MGFYSSEAEKQAAAARLGARPLRVLDCDGNVFLGYALKKGHETFFTDRGFVPVRSADGRSVLQNIPGYLRAADLDRLVGRGILERGNFAACVMDVRLPDDLVNGVNKAVTEGREFSFAFLSSSGMDRLMKVFRFSGVEHPERVTVVGDSGASMYIGGRRQDAYVLANDENAFLTELEGQMTSLWMKDVWDIVARHGFDPSDCPHLFYERKGIAANVHHREILEHYLNPDGERGVLVEGSPLDDEIGAYITRRMLELNETDGPRNSSGALAFKLTGGPCTSEMKIGSVNKDVGAESVLRAAMSLPKEKRPTGALFAGDDLYSPAAKGWGTDAHFFARSRELGETFGLPILTCHTHHAEGGFDGTEPDMTRSIVHLPEDQQFPIDLRVRNPRELNDFILSFQDTRGPDRVPRPVSVPSAAPQPGIS